MYCEGLPVRIYILYAKQPISKSDRLLQLKLARPWQDKAGENMPWRSEFLRSLRIDSKEPIPPGFFILAVRYDNPISTRS
jgi:hypothetical protein